jgi:hypothetical protein
MAMNLPVPQEQGDVLSAFQRKVNTMELVDWLMCVISFVRVSQFVLECLFKNKEIRHYST